MPPTAAARASPPPPPPSAEAASASSLTHRAVASDDSFGRSDLPCSSLSPPPPLPCGREGAGGPRTGGGVRVEAADSN
eukprot:365046-Chlamydomonas_euryale.AAC.4